VVESLIEFAVYVGGWEWFGGGDGFVRERMPRVAGLGVFWEKGVIFIEGEGVIFWWGCGVSDILYQLGAVFVSERDSSLYLNIEGRMTFYFDTKSRILASV
jgi:hypothetical protein